MKIFALGPGGTFGHMAAKRVATLKPAWESQDFQIHFAQTHTTVLKQATTENAFGIIAIRNSLSNNVPDSTAFLAQMSKDHPLTILTELWLTIEQCLLVKKGVTDLKEITSIASFPQASNQCTRRIEELGKKILPACSTADAAQQAARDISGNTAAIGNSLAAELYGLQILERGIQDEQNNQTLFWMFGPRKLALPMTDNILYKKRVLVCQIKDSIGSLSNLLNILKTDSIDVEHLYTYRRGEHLKFIFELRGGLKTLESILAKKVMAFVELGHFT